VLSEADIIAQARERERRLIADIKAHPGLPSRFEALLVYIEDNLLEIRALAAVSWLDPKRCADDYIGHIIATWRQTVRGGEAATEQLQGMLRALAALDQEA
jgi:hypothetical protein